VWFDEHTICYEWAELAYFLAEQSKSIAVTKD
jgi:hypothetical protein